MNAELDEKLCKKYPSIFKDRHGDPKYTSMCWGFDCDDGWYNIIDDLCKKLLKVSPEVYAVQVKQKLGRLCFYVRNCTKEGYRDIEKTTKISRETCEICGKTGLTIKKDGYLKTLCEECRKNWKRSYPMYDVKSIKTIKHILNCGELVMNIQTAQV